VSRTYPLSVACTRFGVHERMGWQHASPLQPGGPAQGFTGGSIGREVISSVGRRFNPPSATPQPRTDRMARTAAARLSTLVLSGLPTVIAWTLMNRTLNTTDFGAVSLAISIPLGMNFILPALGANIANSYPGGPSPLAEAIAHSIRTNLKFGFGILTITSLTVLGPGFDALLRLDGSFPIDRSILIVNVLIALWIVAMIAEWTLIAADRAMTRVWCASLTGPLTLVGVLLLHAYQAPAWLYVVPTPLSMLIASLVSLLFVLRLPDVHPQLVLAALLTRTPRIRSRSVTGALIILEGSLSLALWSARPITSLRENDAQLAAIALSIQYAYPALSLVGVFTQVLWPSYAKRRGDLNRALLIRDILGFMTIGASIGLLYAIVLRVASINSWIHTEIPLSLAIGVGLFIAAQASLQPTKVAFSERRTAFQMAQLSAAVMCTVMLACALLSPSAAWTMSALACGIFTVTFLCVWRFSSMLKEQALASVPNT